MNSTLVTERERRRLESVASDYEKRGFRVKLRPSADQLPEFLAGLKPDLIAAGKDEFVVVEIKARGDVEDQQVVAEIEAALRNRPGWRFELVIDGSDAEGGRLLSAPQIMAALEQADELQHGGYLVPALLLSWSATEGVLRLLAARENVELEDVAPAYVTKRLYTLGLLGRAQYRMLDDAVRLRNQAAHGFQTSITSQDVTNVAGLAREILNELESKTV
jgi:hypothetical protein